MFEECMKCNERAPGCQTRCPYYKKHKENIDKRKELIRNQKAEYAEYKAYKRERFGTELKHD